MAQPQVKFQHNEYIPRLRRRKVVNAHISNKRFKNTKNVSSSSLASIIQLKEEKRDLFYSFISLFIKSGLLIIAIASCFKLALASHQRINRNNEIFSVLKVEERRLNNLYQRFDSLFTIGGKEKLMEEQAQWIEPKSRRIIWR